MDWATLTDAYGEPAVEVPRLLRACASDDPATATDAVNNLHLRLLLREFRETTAARAALPFLIDLAFDPAVVVRARIVRLIHDLAESAGESLPELDPARLATLLDDPDPVVRRRAAPAVALFPDGRVLLRGRLRVETDRVTRWDLTLAAGGGDDLLRDPDPQLRLAAVHAGAAADPGLPAREVGILVDAVRRDDPGWRESAWLADQHGSLLHETAALLRDHPGPASDFILAVARDAGPPRLARLLEEAGTLLATWRTGAEALTPFLVDLLGDPEAGPEVHYRAVYLLGCLAEPACADRLAEPAASEPGAVGDIAVWALSRLGDARCVPGLVERLTGDRLGFEVSGNYVDPDTVSFFFSHPDIGATLRPLRAFAPALVEAVRAGIVTTEDEYLQARLCDVLGAWRSDVDVPLLIDLLDGPVTCSAAAEALGRLGPAAAPALAALRRHPDEPAALWAAWRAGAEPQPAADALALHLGDDNEDYRILRYLADFGPEGVTAVPRVRGRLASPNEWTRVAAAHALWRLTGDTATALPVLGELAGRPESLDVMLPWLSEMGEPAEPIVAPIARAVLDNPRRVGYWGAWRAFTEDEELRRAALAAVS